MKKLTKKEKDLLLDLIVKHLENIENEKITSLHWQKIGASGLQIKQLVEILKNNEYNENRYDDINDVISLHSYFEV